jgi:hypothetical protein
MRHSIALSLYIQGSIQDSYSMVQANAGAFFAEIEKRIE